MSVKTLFREDICMGSGEIMGRSRPNSIGFVLVQKSHMYQISSNYLPNCDLYIAHKLYMDSQPTRRTDNVKSTQKVILSRTVYFKVLVRRFFLCVTTSAQTHNPPTTFGGVGYNDVNKTKYE